VFRTRSTCESLGPDDAVAWELPDDEEFPLAVVVSEHAVAKRMAATAAPTAKFLRPHEVRVME